MTKARTTKAKNYDGDRNNDKGKNNFKGKTIIKVNTMTTQTSSVQIQKQSQKEAQQKKLFFCESSCDFKNCVTQQATKQNLNDCFQLFQCFQFTTMH